MLHAMTTRHRINHAASALRWRGKGSPRALALARCRKKSRVSSDHCPPTSHARTTRRDLPNWPDNSGYRLSSAFWLSPTRPHPLSCSAVERPPFFRRGDTMVVSMASWAPWCSGKPSATTSKLGKDGPCLRIITLAPASLHTPCSG